MSGAIPGGKEHRAIYPVRAGGIGPCIRMSGAKTPRGCASRVALHRSDDAPNAAKAAAGGGGVAAGAGDEEAAWADDGAAAGAGTVKTPGAPPAAGAGAGTVMTLGLPPSAGAGGLATVGVVPGLGNAPPTA